MKGKLIIFEGIDGVGKATQTKLLAKALRAEGKKVTVFTSPWYAIPTGKLVRRALSGEFGDFVHMHPYMSALPYLLDFAAWSANIRDALKQGDVICDRYVQSTLAYHAAKLKGAARKKFLKDISGIAFKSIHLPKPDAVVLLDVPVTVSQTLMGTKKKDQHETNTAYQKNVSAVYKDLSRAKDWHMINCAPKGRMRARDDIHDEIRRMLSR